MLAEKYRPRDFSQVIGQQKVINGMRWYLDQPKESLTSGLVFLITGPTGQGETTLAQCAARHWGVNDWDICEIRSTECDVNTLRDVDQRMYTYGSGRHGRKMYLLDEVHTITGRAALRLLSLLESIPAHVMLVGTTTETDWTGLTLLSRWVPFTLQKVRSQELAAYLRQIAELEGLPIPDDPAYFDKLTKYNGLSIRDHLQKLPARLLDGALVAA